MPDESARRPIAADTMALNRSMDRFDGHHSVWLFGYGSLIWKADFPFIERRTANIRGWSRRFWQGSHDHRGTPERPGRVLTLMPQPDSVCEGMAYLVTPDVFVQLDHRERNGYLRLAIDIHFDGCTVEGLIYIARQDNPAFLGEAPEREIARQIASASGPSGRNRDYVIRLAKALRDLGKNDPHVFAIERYLEELAEPEEG